MATQRELMSYVAQKVYEHRDEIAPELVDYITGDSFEAIDQSIARVKQSTANLISNIGGFCPQDIREGTTAASSDAQLAAQINAMSAEEFAQYRQTIGLGR
jgi:hypothetical protein